MIKISFTDIQIAITVIASTGCLISGINSHLGCWGVCWRWWLFPGILAIHFQLKMDATCHLLLSNWLQLVTSRAVSFTSFFTGFPDVIDCVLSSLETSLEINVLFYTKIELFQCLEQFNFQLISNLFLFKCNLRFLFHNFIFLLS